jgi:hypothetical protein
VVVAEVEIFVLQRLRGSGVKVGLVFGFVGNDIGVDHLLVCTDVYVRTWVCARSGCFLAQRLLREKCGLRLKCVPLKYRFKDGLAVE